MPSQRRAPLLNLLLAIVMLAGALGPAWQRVLTVAHVARLSGACLPSQGAHASAVRQGHIPHGHDAACDHCEACAAFHGDALAVGSSPVPWRLLALRHLAPQGLAHNASPDLARAPPLARGPPLIV